MDKANRKALQDAETTVKAAAQLAVLRNKIELSKNRQ